MWPSSRVDRLSVVQLDVEILVDALQDAADHDFILELDGNLLFNERLVETVRECKSATILD